jgi:hypothetical protein
MQEHGKKYGYTISLRELPFKSGHTLWKAVLQYIQQIGATNGGKDTAKQYLDRLQWRVNAWGDYNRCHYWNNFELLDLQFFRSRKWVDFFAFIDRQEGVWTERWGDALIRTLGVDMMLDPSEIEEFQDIGYKHHDIIVNPCGAKVPPGMKLHEGERAVVGACSPFLAKYPVLDLLIIALYFFCDHMLLMLFLCATALATVKLILIPAFHSRKNYSI